MKFDPKDPPRVFTVGVNSDIDLKDCGNLALSADEQITLTHDNGEIDITAKDFGYYLTPSINSRMPRFGLSARLIRNKDTGHIFVLAVRDDRLAEYEAYCAAEHLEEIADLTDDAVRRRLDLLKGDS